MKKSSLLHIALAAVLCGCPHVEDTSVQADMPEAVYDEKTKTLTVTGTEGYGDMTFPEGSGTASLITVYDDAFTLQASGPLLRDAGIVSAEDLGSFLSDTDSSLQFLKEYLRDNAGGPCGEDTGIPVIISIEGDDFGFRKEEDAVTLNTGGSVIHTEFLYLLSLAAKKSTGWEQMGYAWYLGTCIDPYSHLLHTLKVSDKEPYYHLCLQAGADLTDPRPADIRIINDAVSRIAFEKGLTHWGSRCESYPVTDEPVYRRVKLDRAREQDRKLSAFMAASFLAWLDEQHGFEKVSLFCFGHKTFEEAFGADFGSTYEDWKAYIIAEYPMDQ
ncbi:MAG: hypothetical protein K6G61_11420 [Solobacterium sp.]|nr:hypothetical protein [Solobacterium sp.]